MLLEHFLKVRVLDGFMRTPQVGQQSRQWGLIMFQELKTVSRSISIKEKLDLVLEKNAAQIILYMKEDTTDMTQKVIDAYNSLKQSGGG